MGYISEKAGKYASRKVDGMKKGPLKSTFKAVRGAHRIADSAVTSLANKGKCGVLHSDGRTCANNLKPGKGTCGNRDCIAEAASQGRHH